jgi:hypothetical protein
VEPEDFTGLPIDLIQVGSKNALRGFYDCPKLRIDVNIYLTSEGGGQTVGLNPRCRLASFQ